MNHFLLSDALVDQLAEQGYVSIENFITSKHLEALLGDIQFWQEQDAFKQAGIGKLVDHQIDKAYRRDKIKWINPDACRPATAKVLKAANELMQQLNRECFLSMKDFECHYAMYEQNDYYKKHVDQFNNNSHRILSFVLYLNYNWQPSDGGELVMYFKKNKVTIAPEACKLVLFKSDIPHEVLPVNTERYSITGWMKDQFNAIPFL